MPSIRSFRIAAWLLVVAIALMTVCPIGLRPVTGLSVDLERFAAFGLVGLFFGLAYPRRRIAVLAAVVAAAAGLEAMQYLAPSRHGRVHDFEIKAVAGALGAVSAMLFGRVAREAALRRPAG
ncbi:hypothetical protein [Alsobacter sp. SYSU BS001988]